ncbi:MAG: endonuclease III [Planctomycetes bacterium]|nr:endonuclease III [Planctomycetota bacterium]
MSAETNDKAPPKVPARRTLSPLTRMRRRVRRILNGLARLHPDAACALHFEGPLQLLVATILSAQCTDQRVNMVTPALFARYPDARAFGNAKQEELEQLIQSTGFFRSKARNIIACCREIVAKYDGQVPATMDELVPLAGVGRKTANVVLGNAFAVPGIPVDTHMARLSQRMGLTVHTDPVKIERDLMLVVPKKEWTMFGHRMIQHGRMICHARCPLCEQCGLAKLCPQVGVNQPPAEENCA